MLADIGSTWAGELFALLSIPTLVAMNGYFVAAEFSLVAIRSTKVEEMIARGDPRAKSVAAATENLDRTIAATQLGITLASIALGWVGEPALAHLIDPVVNLLPESWHGTVLHTLATGIDFMLITFMHVVFGELIPKSIALQAPEGTSLVLSAPLNAFIKVARPLITVMNGVGNGVLRLFGFKPASGDESAHSIEELRMIIEDTEEAGLIDEDQAEFVHNVFMLSGKQVADCMVPRDKMAALDVSTPPDKVLEAVRSGAHTRMPVYDGDLNKVVGIVNTKDLFYLFSLSGVVVLEDAIYPPTYLEPGESVANALRLLKRSRKPMALVRDGEGHILGMITLEDILEEIVGDIEDEHDRPMPKLVVRRRKGKALAPGPAPAKPGEGKPSAPQKPPVHDERGRPDHGVRRP